MATAEELPHTFICRLPTGATYEVRTVGDYLAAIRELLHGEAVAIYREDETVELT
jgi:hypothetical protein